MTAGLRTDPGRFTAVYDRYFRDIYRYVAGRLDVQAADDVAAETFLVVAFGQRHRFDSAPTGTYGTSSSRWTAPTPGARRACVQP